jgi:hypothetical protein
MVRIRMLMVTLIEDATARERDAKPKLVPFRLNMTCQLFLPFATSHTDINISEVSEMRENCSLS